MVALPDKFLAWNYYPRRTTAENLLQDRAESDMNKLFLEITRHTPALCTACMNSDGSVFINAKIVGMGYVLKRKYLGKAIKALVDHLSMGDELFAGIENESERREKLRTYQKKTMELFLRYLYFEPEEAAERIDFSKLSTIELAKMMPESSKHTWFVVQSCKRASVVFYRPPNISFELHGQLEIHEKGKYHEFVNLVHDAVGYAPPDERVYEERPVYIFNVEAVFDNSPSPAGWGTQIA